MTAWRLRAMEGHRLRWSANRIRRRTAGAVTQPNTLAIAAPAVVDGWINTTAKNDPVLMQQAALELEICD